MRFHSAVLNRRLPWARVKLDRLDLRWIDAVQVEQRRPVSISTGSAVEDQHLVEIDLRVAKRGRRALKTILGIRPISLKCDVPGRAKPRRAPLAAHDLRSWHAFENRSQRHPFELRKVGTREEMAEPEPPVLFEARHLAIDSVLRHVHGLEYDCPPQHDAPLDGFVAVKGQRRIRGTVAHATYEDPMFPGRY